MNLKYHNLKKADPLQDWATIQMQNWHNSTIWLTMTRVEPVQKKKKKNIGDRGVTVTGVTVIHR